MDKSNVPPCQPPKATAREGPARRWTFASAVVTIMTLVRPMFTPMAAHAQEKGYSIACEQGIERVYSLSNRAYAQHPLISTPQIGEQGMETSLSMYGNNVVVADAAATTQRRSDGVQWFADKWEREGIVGKAGMVGASVLVGLPIASRTVKAIGRLGRKAGSLLAGKEYSIYVTLVQVGTVLLAECAKISLDAFNGVRLQS